MGFPSGSDGKESACNARDLGSIPGLGRSPGEGKDHPVQYSGLEKAGSDHTEWKNPEAATVVSTQHTNSWTGQAILNRYQWLASQVNRNFQESPRRHTASAFPYTHIFPTLKEGWTSERE